MVFVTFVSQDRSFRSSRTSAVQKNLIPFDGGSVRARLDLRLLDAQRSGQRTQLRPANDLIAELRARSTSPSLDALQRGVVGFPFMKKSLGAKTLVYPTPVFVVGTYDPQGKPNVMTASWGGICCSRPPCVAVSLRKATYTHGNLVAQKAFTISIPSEAHVRAADHFGLVSGRAVDKFAAAKLTRPRWTAPTLAASKRPNIRNWLVPPFLSATTQHPL